MAAFFTIEIEGHGEFTRALKRLDKKLARKIVRQALKPAADALKNAVQHEAPVDTGKLVANMTLSGFRTSKGAARYEVMLPTRTALGVSPGATGYYPAAVLYGTKNMPPNDFVGRAVAKSGDKLRRMALAKIADGIERAMA